MHLSVFKQIFLYVLFAVPEIVVSGYKQVTDMLVRRMLTSNIIILFVKEDRTEDVKTVEGERSNWENEESE